MLLNSKNSIQQRIKSHKNIMKKVLQNKIKGIFSTYT